MSSFLKVLVQTGFTQVLHEDIFAINAVKVVLYVVGSAVFAIRPAFFLLKLIGAHWAGPGYKAGRNVYITLQLVRKSVKFFDEVEGELIIGTIPDFYLRNL